MERVAIIGASPKETRYANRAQKMLKEYGHHPIPVNPAFDMIEGEPTFASLKEVDGHVDTVTLYVNPRRGVQYIEDIVAIHPNRVIMNPGTESHVMKEIFEEQGINVVEGCTLVMLRTEQF